MGKYLKGCYFLYNAFARMHMEETTMIQTYLRHVVWGACCLMLMTSCDRSPSNPNHSSLLKEGFTSGGRKFQVFGESTPSGDLKPANLTLTIEDEADFVISCRQNWLSPYVCLHLFTDSIRVDDMTGSQDLVYVHWQSNGTIGGSTTGEGFYHYAVFPRGDAAHVLLRGVAFQSVSSGRVYYYGAGDYKLAYENNSIHVTEHWKGFSGEGYSYTGTAEEKIVSRTFVIQPQEATILTCEERIRTLRCTVNDSERLNSVEWYYRVTSPADDPDLCAPIAPKRCVLNGTCTHGGQP